jgi:hydroxypyruvate isomerase
MNRRDVIAGGLTAAGLTACAVPGRALSPQAVQAALSGFAVNIESWWRDQPFEKRFDTARRAGFSHAEFWFIDSWERSAAQLKSHIPEGLKIAQIVGDSPALARSGVRGEFLENCKRAIENAHVLGAKVVTLTGHQNVEGISKTQALKSYLDHMAAAASLFEDAKLYAAIEPFNPYNHPGHFIYGHAEALAICEAINSPFLKLNWDLFHMQRHEGNLIANFQKGKDQICYVQIADSPDRHQPGTGEIDHHTLLRAVRAHYSGPIGLEFFAKNDNYAAALEAVIGLGIDLT